jgi:hypothetical protein
MTDEEIMGIMGEYAYHFPSMSAIKSGMSRLNPPYWYFPFYYTNPDIG